MSLPAQPPVPVHPGPQPKHSRCFSLSASNRWLVCTASVALGLSAPPSHAGKDAADGTYMHALAYHYNVTGEVATGAAEERLGDEGVRLLKAAVRMTDEPLVGAVEVYFEQRVSIVSVDEELYGTMDLGWRDADGAWHIADYKFGYHPVSPDSPQLKLYMLGLLEELGHGIGPGPYWVHIIQPKQSGEVQSHEVTQEELLELRLRLHEVTSAVRRGETVYAIGEHCRFCPAIQMCPAVKQAAAEMWAFAMSAGKPGVERMDMADLVRCLERFDALEKFIKEVRHEAEQRLENGAKVPGYKLVDKRANRQWRDEAQAAASLVGMGVRPYREVLLSPAQAEKELPADRREALVPLVTKTSSGTTLAAEKDKRPVAVSGAAIFNSTQAEMIKDLLK